MWFTEQSATVDKIGRITISGNVIEYPAGGSRPLGIVAGPDGALYYTDLATP